MSYTVTRHDDATALLAAAEPFLLQREALNSLILGAARAAERGAAPRRRRPPLCLTVSGPTGPALVALSSAGRRLLLADNEAATDEALDTLVAALAATPRAVPDVFAHQALARRFAERWSAAIGQSARLIEQQHLFEATAIALPPITLTGRLRPATVRESDVLSDWLMAFQDSTTHHDAGDRHAAGILVDGLLARKDLYVWDVGDRRAPRPVTMAARSRPSARGIAISLVYTPPEERGRGYAAACVAHLSQLLLDSNWQFCTLFADATNAAASVVFERIGYKPIADFVAYRFDTPPIAPRRLLTSRMIAL